MDWYVHVLKNYVNFRGRARRKEYWMFMLVNFGIIAVLSLLQFFTVHTQVLTGSYGLAVLLPQWAVSVRRLHDTGRSGWWILLGLIPVVGGIILFIFYLQDSHFGDNQYGLNPKYEPDPYHDDMTRKTY